MFDSNKSNAISWFFFGCFYVLRQTVLTKQPRKKTETPTKYLIQMRKSNKKNNSVLTHKKYTVEFV